MFVLINGSSSNFEQHEFTKQNFNNILAISERLLQNNNRMKEEGIVLMFSGLSGADMLNIYLANKYNYELECHFPCKFNIETSEFEIESMMNEHKKFQENTGIDSLKLISEFINKRNPKIKVYNGYSAKNKKISSKCDYLLSFTWITNEIFEKLIHEKNTEPDTILTWLTTKNNIIKHHYCINKIIDCDIENKYNLITRNLEEIIGDDEILPILMKRDLKCYWGTAPTKSPHIGYLYPMLKIADLVDAGCNVTILIADLHAFLDNMKSPLEKIKTRSKYYIEVLTSILEIYKVDLRKVNFITGTEYQLSPAYTMDVYKFGNLTTIRDTKHAGTEVVKQIEYPNMTSLLYPSLQALDEEYLKVDCALTGIDQRKINTFSREFMPKLGYSKRIHLMNPVIPGLSTVQTNGELIKMSSSDINGKIDLVDSAKSIRKKINKSYCIEGNIIDNTPLLLIKNLVFKILDRFKQPFIINRPEKYGGNIYYNTFSEIENDFSEKKLHPGDLKLGLSDFFVELLMPVREKFNKKEFNELLMDAYQ